jgi:putative transposase
MLYGEVRLGVREIIKQVCDEMGVTIVNGALSRYPVRMFVEIPPQVSVSNFVRRAKGRSPRKIQQNTSESARSNASGKEATSPPHPATSPMMSSCDNSTDIPTKTASAPPLTVISTASAGQRFSLYGLSAATRRFCPRSAAFG